MKKLPVFSYILIILLSLTLLSIGTISIFSIKTLSDFIYSEVESSLKEEAKLIHNTIHGADAYSNESLQAFTDNLLTDLSLRVTFISLNGTVLADSHKDYNLMENHKDRPEVIEALRGNYGRSNRFSSTLSKHMLYVTAPATDKNIIVRVALSVDHIRDKFFKTFTEIIIFSIIILLITVIISIFTANSFTSVIRSIKNISSFYSKGDFSRKLPENGPKEVSQLKISINSMGEQLQRIVNKVSIQKNELHAMLNSMVDSVILLDTNLLVKEMNPASEILLQKELNNCRGKKINQIIDNIEIVDLVETALNNSQLQEDSVWFHKGLEQYLQVHCTPIYDSDGSSKGILLVMNNMTRMKQLENMRKDFVANVSHELKTPVTLINGYVETLIDGAIENREKLNKFLNIINRHSVRITHIIDDLLILSKIEDQGTNIQAETVGLYDILFSAYTSCLSNAEKENIIMNIDCSDSIKLTANTILLEQAVYNLISNAIKYAGTGSNIKISGLLFGKEGKKYIKIIVEDNGKGMAAEQVDRIFERFYRINRKQSKKNGGTGLGLSIVKHIVLAHSGTINVNSTEEKGSQFIIEIPIL